MGYSVKIFGRDLFMTSPDHLDIMQCSGTGLPKIGIMSEYRHGKKYRFRIMQRPSVPSQTVPWSTLSDLKVPNESTGCTSLPKENNNISILLSSEHIRRETGLRHLIFSDSVICQRVISDVIPCSLRL